MEFNKGNNTYFNIVVLRGETTITTLSGSCFVHKMAVCLCFYLQTISIKQVMYLDISKVHENDLAMLGSLVMCTVYTNKFTFQLIKAQIGPLNKDSRLCNVGLHMCVQLMYQQSHLNIFLKISSYLFWSDFSGLTSDHIYRNSVFVFIAQKCRESLNMFTL